MKKNMGKSDSMIRAVIAVIIAVLYFTNQISGTSAMVLGIIAIVFAITSITGICPLYIPFGIKTSKKK